MFFAGWALASVLIVQGAERGSEDGGDMAPAWFFVAGTGALVLAVANRDLAARRRSDALLRNREALIASLGVVTDQRLTQLPLYQLLNELLDRARAVLSADTAAVFLLDRERGLLELEAASGFERPRAPIRVAVGEGVIGRVAASRRGLALVDAPTDPAIVPGTASLLAAGLVAEGQLLGVLQLGTTQRRDFSDDEVRLLQVVADRAAVAIDSSRHEREALRATLSAEAARRRLALLADAGEVLGRSFDRVEAMADELGKALVPAFVDWFAFHQLDDEGEPRLTAWQAGTSVDVGATLGGDWHDAVQNTLAHRRAVVVWGTGIDGAIYRPARDLALTSLVIVPVMVRSLALGTMIFGTAGDSRGFRKGDVDTLQDLAARVAVAIERVLLVADTQRSATRAARHAAQLQRLTEGAFAINAAMATPYLAPVVVEQAARVLDADAAWVDLDESASGDAVRVAEHGARRADAHVASAVVTGEGGVPIGCVAASRTAPPFSGEEEAILGSLAHMTSVALANARLYGTVQDSETRLRALYDASPVAIVELDQQGTALRWNRAAERLFSWPAYDDELVGSVTVPAPALGVVRTVLEEDTATSAEVSLGEDEQRVELEVVAVPLRERSGRRAGVVLAAVDVTERKQVAEQLQQAQRMEAVARMAGGIAHDFNNVLMVITGYADLVLRRPVDDEVRADVDAMRSAASRAAEFTRKLLTVSRRQMVQVQRVDVAEAITSLGDVLDVMVGDRVKFDLVVDSPPSVDIDPAQLEQLVLNLAINAKDAMPEGGELRIEVGALEDDDGARFARITISDTGEGMDPETAEHCFEPFFTTKDRTKGTGLGLSTAYGVVTQAGGDITVESHRGVGTTFTIHLPAAVGEASPVIEVGGEDGATLRVLVVDDDPDVRAVVADMLELEGHEPTVAAGGAAALDVLDEAAPDVLLTDVVMPDMRGPDLAREVLARQPRVRVVLMSSHVDDELALGETIEGTVFLAKPFTSHALADALAAAMSGQGSKR